MSTTWQAHYSPDVGWNVGDWAYGDSSEVTYYCQTEESAVRLAVHLTQAEALRAALEYVKRVLEQYRPGATIAIENVLPDIDAALDNFRAGRQE